MGAVIGASVVSALAIAPAFAAATVSQATAQSLDLAIGGTHAITQIVTASNDGTTETKNNASTIPNLATLFPTNNLLGPGVAPQDAFANSDGTSYACAGIAGTGSSGILNIGNTHCDIDAKPLTLSLGNLSLGTTAISAGALQTVLGPILNGPLAGLLAQAVGALSTGLASTPLGQIQIGGSLSAIEGECHATPTAATGRAHLVDTSGAQQTTPISVTVPNGSGGTQKLSLVNLPVNPPANTHVLVNLNVVSQTIITAVNTELTTAVGGALQPLAVPLGAALQQVQDAVVNALVANLQPVLTALQANILDITLNKQVVGDSGRSIAVTALDAQVLPAAAQFAGASLISGILGKVTCGPNAGRSITPPTSTPTTPGNPSGPNTPAVVDAGLTGQSSHTARDVLAATTALMMLAGTAGLIGYRRMLTK